MRLLVRLLIAVTVAAWLYLLFLHGLGRRDLWNSHEARAGMDARSVLAGDGWPVPHLHDGRAELQKPPLYYWLVALAAKVRGGAVDAAAVRLPSALAAILCIGFVGFLGWKAGRAAEGLLAAAVLATAVHFTWLGRVGRIDMPLTCAVTVALGCFYSAKPQAARRWLVGGYVAVAVGVMLKGPIGLVLPAAVLGLFLLLDGRAHTPLAVSRRLGLWWGLPLVAVLAGPWYWWANEATGGELFRVFFWHHNVERGLGGSRLRGHPWWFYGPQLLFDLLPWSLVLPAALWYFFRRRMWRDDREARFGLAWLLAVVGVLSCARYKRADYLVPAYPGLALFLGCVLVRWYRECAAGGTRMLGLLPARAARVGLPLLLAGAAVGWWVRVDLYLPAGEPRLEQHSFAQVVRERVPSPEPVLFFQTESHALAFHVGRPLRILLHWEELEQLAGDDGARFVVMEADTAAGWEARLSAVRLERVAGNGDGLAGGHEKPLVLFRMVPVIRTTRESRVSE